ncbi:MAG: hypothetical protein NTV89_03445 [Proteobacteria bacterium]|nr:hypothetical protein [Pseudomonadota bacterium]
MMKKLMMFTAVASLCLFFVAFAAQAQGFVDRADESVQIVAGGKMMLAYVKKLTSAQNPDRAWLADQGHILIRRGFNYMDQGQMDYSEDASSCMQQIGQQLLNSGGALVKIGRNQGPLTQQEKDEIAKQAGYLKKIGDVMVNKGQVWGG